MQKRKVFRFKSAYQNPKLFINGVGEITPENLNSPRVLEEMLRRKFFARMIEEAEEGETSPETDENSENVETIEGNSEELAGAEETTQEPEESKLEGAGQEVEPPQVETIEFESLPYDKQLAKAGFDTIEKVRNASDEELIAIKGIAETSLAKIREALNG